MKRNKPIARRFPFEETHFRHAPHETEVSFSRASNGPRTSRERSSRVARRGRSTQSEGQDSDDGFVDVVPGFYTRQEQEAPRDTPRTVSGSSSSSSCADPVAALADCSVLSRSPTSVKKTAHISAFGHVRTMSTRGPSAAVTSTRYLTNAGYRHRRHAPTRRENRARAHGSLKSFIFYDDLSILSESRPPHTSAPRTPSKPSHPPSSQHLGEPQCWVGLRHYPHRRPLQIAHSPPTESSREGAASRYVPGTTRVTRADEEVVDERTAQWEREKQELWRQQREREDAADAARVARRVRGIDQVPTTDAIERPATRQRPSARSQLATSQPASFMVHQEEAAVHVRSYAHLFERAADLAARDGVTDIEASAGTSPPRQDTHTQTACDVVETKGEQNKSTGTTVAEKGTQAQVVDASELVRDTIDAQEAMLEYLRRKIRKMEKDHQALLRNERDQQPHQMNRPHNATPKVKEQAEGEKNAMTHLAHTHAQSSVNTSVRGQRAHPDKSADTALSSRPSSPGRERQDVVQTVEGTALGDLLALYRLLSAPHANTPHNSHHGVDVSGIASPAAISPTAMTRTAAITHDANDGDDKYGRASSSESSSRSSRSSSSSLRVVDKRTVRHSGSGHHRHHSRAPRSAHGDHIGKPQSARQRRESIQKPDQLAGRARAHGSASPSAVHYATDETVTGTVLASLVHRYVTAAHADTQSAPAPAHTRSPTSSFLSSSSSDFSSPVVVERLVTADEDRALYLPGSTAASAAHRSLFARHATHTPPASSTVPLRDNNNHNKAHSHQAMRSTKTTTRARRKERHLDAVRPAHGATTPPASGPSTSLSVSSPSRQEVTPVHAEQRKTVQSTVASGDENSGHPKNAHTLTSSSRFRVPSDPRRAAAKNESTAPPHVGDPIAVNAGAREEAIEEAAPEPARLASGVRDERDTDAARTRTHRGDTEALAAVAHRAVQAAAAAVTSAARARSAGGAYASDRRPTTRPPRGSAVSHRTTSSVGSQAALASSLTLDQSLRQTPPSPNARHLSPSLEADRSELTTPIAHAQLQRDTMARAGETQAESRRDAARVDHNSEDGQAPVEAASSAFSPLTLKPRWEIGVGTLDLLIDAPQPAHRRDQAESGVGVRTAQLASATTSVVHVLEGSFLCSTSAASAALLAQPNERGSVNGPRRTQQTQTRYTKEFPPLTAEMFTVAPSQADASPSSVAMEHSAAGSALTTTSLPSARRTAVIELHTEAEYDPVVVARLRRYCRTLESSRQTLLKEVQETNSIAPQSSGVFGTSFSAGAESAATPDPFARARPSRSYFRTPYADPEVDATLHKDDDGETNGGEAAAGSTGAHRKELGRSHVSMSSFSVMSHGGGGAQTPPVRLSPALQAALGTKIVLNEDGYGGVTKSVIVESEEEEGEDKKSRDQQQRPHGVHHADVRGDARGESATTGSAQHLRRTSLRPPPAPPRAELFSVASSITSNHAPSASYHPLTGHAGYVARAPPKARAGTKSDREVHDDRGEDVFATPSMPLSPILSDISSSRDRHDEHAQRSRPHFGHTLRYQQEALRSSPRDDALSGTQGTRHAHRIASSADSPASEVLGRGTRPGTWRRASSPRQGTPASSFSTPSTSPNRSLEEARWLWSARRARLEQEKATAAGAVDQERECGRQRAPRGEELTREDPVLANDEGHSPPPRAPETLSRPPHVGGARWRDSASPSSVMPASLSSLQISADSSWQSGVGSPLKQRATDAPHDAKDETRLEPMDTETKKRNESGDLTHTDHGAAAPQSRFRVPSSSSTPHASARTETTASASSGRARFTPRRTPLTETHSALSFDSSHVPLSIVTSRHATVTRRARDESEDARRGRSPTQRPLVSPPRKQSARDAREKKETAPYLSNTSEASVSPLSQHPDLVTAFLDSTSFHGDDDGQTDDEAADALTSETGLVKETIDIDDRSSASSFSRPHASRPVMGDDRPDEEVRDVSSGPNPEAGATEPAVLTPPPPLHSPHHAPPPAVRPHPHSGFSTTRPDSSTNSQNNNATLGNRTRSHKHRAQSHRSSFVNTPLYEGQSRRSSGSGDDASGLVQSPFMWSASAPSRRLSCPTTDVFHANAGEEDEEVTPPGEGGVCEEEGQGRQTCKEDVKPRVGTRLVSPSLDPDEHGDDEVVFEDCLPPVPPVTMDYQGSRPDAVDLSSPGSPPHWLPHSADTTAPLREASREPTMPRASSQSRSPPRGSRVSELTPTSCREGSNEEEDYDIAIDVPSPFSDVDAHAPRSQKTYASRPSRSSAASPNSMLSSVSFHSAQSRGSFTSSP